MIQCLLFASTAVPVFLLARGAGLARRACHLAAALSIVAPWCVVSGSFLSESAAYPAYAWSLYATWVAVTRPSLRHDLLALLVIAIAVVSRTAMLALAPLLPLAVIWQEWSVGLAGERPARRLRALPRRLWRSHRVLSAICVAALACMSSSRRGCCRAA